MKQYFYQIDKLQHFIAGTLLALAGNIAHTPELGIGFGIGYGIGKELWDKLSGKGTPDRVDAIATILGALVVYMGVVL